MANIIIVPEQTFEQKLQMMRESASYDIADDDDDANCPELSDIPGLTGIRAPKAPPKVPKIFVSNNCIFNCSYCCMRSGNDSKRRYTNEPRELARMSVNAANSNKDGPGVFISSAIHRNADHTEELIVETLRVMRHELGYRNYIHAKIMPGADPKLIEEAGWLADRLSVNIELPKSEGYATIAKQKNRTNILTPMGDISSKIAEHSHEFRRDGKRFAKSGQTTQIMVGAMNETDRTQIVLAEALYKKYRLRRVYYSPFTNVWDFDFLPADPTPHWRTRRLYQADRLLQLYGFKANDVVPEDSPDLSDDIDPKAEFALRNLHLYPVEVNTADYELLIRVPGIGVTSAKKIVQARKYAKINHDLLLKMGIWMKRAVYFITCEGKYKGGDFWAVPRFAD